MQNGIFENIFLMIALIFVISGAFMLSKKTKAMYEILLVLTGGVIASIAAFANPSLAPYFHLDPELLLFGFLPILLLQIAYTMPYKDIVRSIRPIGLLAIVSPVISSVVIALFIHAGAEALGYEIPFLIVLLFGAIMSSTDPVTVLSIFQKIGAPKKLILLFEGESLFNDGASLALFFLVLSWLLGGSEHITVFDTLVKGIFGNNIAIGSILSFTSMILGGALLGIASGIFFSKILHYLRKHQYLAILVIVISAYSTFLVADLMHSYLLPASSVIATIFSTFIIGNYGRFKIDIQTEELAQSIFAFIAFLVNSTIFLFIGASVLGIHTGLLSIFLWIIPIVIVGVIIGRAVSVYLPIGLMNIREEDTDKIPLSWQHVLSWGSLRGGLALTLVALIPESSQFPFSGEMIQTKDFLGILVIAAVFFSIFIKTLTLETLIKKLGINRLSTIEKIEEEETKLITITSMIENVEKMHAQKYLSLHERNYLLDIYGQRRNNILNRSKILMQKAEKHSAFSKAVSLYALALERHFAKELYMHGDVTEKPLKKFLAITDIQAHRLRSGKTQIREIFQESYRNDFFERLESALAKIVNPDPHPLFTEYMILRARVMILDQTLRSLGTLRDLAESLGKMREYERVENLYIDFREKAIAKKEAFDLRNSEHIPEWQEKILETTFKNLEETVMQDLSKKELVSERFAHILKIRESDFESFLEQYGANLALMEKEGESNMRNAELSA